MKDRSRPSTLKKERRLIVRRFNKYVRGTKDFRPRSGGHDGQAGHGLEKRMRLSHNCSVAPDFPNYEMKIGTKSKMTFGDWSPDYWMFKDPGWGVTRDRFMEIFGKYNAVKMRYSWSGSPVPKVGKFNHFGQIMRVSKDGTIKAVYSFSRDKRPDKRSIVPRHMQKENLVLAEWRSSTLRARVEKKFGLGGCFRCLKDGRGRYDRIVFGSRITFGRWVAAVRSGAIFLDSGMHQGNSRNYASWRVYNSNWPLLAS